MSLTKCVVLIALAIALVACDTPPPSAPTSEPATGAAPVEREHLPGEAVDARAEAAPGETFGAVETVPKTLGPHWVWASDASMSAMPDGRAYLIDGDTGRYLGGLNTGYSFNSLTLPRHYREIYSAETYYSRHTRGTRTDVVSFYDPLTLTPTHEIELPPKRGSTLPRLNNTAITDDDRFMAVFNITPATSLSIVDLQARKFVGEIDTPGCSMAYTAGTRTLFSLCTDGSLMTIHMDDGGTASAKQASPPFFVVSEDPITENGARYGQKWLFASVMGYVYTIDFSSGEPVFDEPWSLLSDAERAENWRIGGWQHLAVHETSGRLYSIMHQGGFDTYQEPGHEIWVYDLARKTRVAVITTVHETVSIEVTQDDSPLLFGIAADAPALDVYDVMSSSHLRTVDELGSGLSLLQVPWRK